MSRVDLIVDPLQRVRVTDKQLDDARGLYQDSHRNVAEDRRFINSHFWRYAANHNPESRRILSTAGLISGSMGSYDYPLPNTVASDFIALRQSYGVFEREATKIPVLADVGSVPKRGTEATGGWLVEAGSTNQAAEWTLTAADLSFGSVEYRLRKLAAMCLYSTELAEDSVSDFSGVVERSIARTFAEKLDDASFNGDGTSTYGHVLGYKHALHSDAVKTASTATPTSLVAADFAGCLAKLQKFDSPPKWYMHSAVLFGVVMSSLEEHVDISGGRIFFMGLEVVQCNSLHSVLTSSTGQMLCYAGSIADSALLAYRGEIKVVSQDTSGSAFNNDLIATRATQRLAPVVHARGAAAADRAMVGLRLA